MNRLNKYACLFGLLFLLYIPGVAQELRCGIQVSAPTMQSDKQIFQEMQKAIQEYVNMRAWTNHSYEQHEKINCNIQIIINERPAMDYFKGQLQLKITRPIFNSSYETVICNLTDADFNLRYVQYQNLEFSENTYIDNLTSLLNFYAYLILSFDYNTFSINGGREYLAKAQEVLNLAQNGNESGWQSFDGNKSRYALISELNNSRYSKFNNAMYLYHRQGLDMMSKDVNKGRQNVLNALRELQKLNLQNSGLYIIRIFNQAKSAEIRQIFAKAYPHEKQELLRIMESLNPSELNDYRSILDVKE